MANTYLTRTPSSTGNRKKWTYSAWIKNTSGSNYERLYESDGDNEYFRFNDTKKLFFRTNNGSNGGFTTARVFRDTNAWYHIVLRVDTTLGTAGDRIRLYVNGVEETVFDTETQVAQNYDTYSNYATKVIKIGSSNFDGCMSHIHFADGSSLAPTVFGSVDSVTGEWKINTAPSFTPGTNGFTILKDGNTITDQSANSNNFSLGAGTLTNTKDCPSNVLATLNPLDVMKQSGGIYVPTFSNGNTTMSASATNNYQTFGSIAVDTGKYYWEMKCPNGGNGNLGSRIGLFHGDNKVHGGSYYYGADGYNVHQNGSIYTNGSSTAYMAGFSNNIIITFALDKTNGKSYVGANGYWSNGAGATNASFANAVAVETKLSTTMPDKTTYAFFDVYGSTIQHINFGNGYFGTSAITTNSGNGYAGAEGASKFYYQPPSGYSALSTKGLNN